MRHVLILLLFTTPASAWQTGAEGRVCTLEHATADIALRLTHDPVTPLYSIALSRAAPWSDAAFFAIRFEGPHPNEIGTARHVLSEDARSLSVTDRGFSNVLDGMQFNDSFTAVIGDQTVTVSLAGAAEPVAIFRECRAAVPSS